MRAQFASGRNQICPITTTLTTGSITSGKARTYYFWLQARNCIGYTLLSTTSTITATVGSGIRLTFPSDCFRDGENWERYAVSFSTTNDPSNASLLLEIPAIDINQNPISLPLSIDLTLDSHLVFETSTATLPNNVPHGFIVNYTSKGKLYRYDSTSSLIANGEDIIAATVGNWISFSETNTFDIYVNDTTSSVLGCDVAIEDLNNNYLISQYYAGDGSDSFFRRIWLYNDTTVNVNEGERIGLTVDLQGVDVSASFTDLLTLVFEGYVDKATGEIDIYEDDTVTLLPYVNVTQDYTAAKSSTLTIPKPLLPNVSYQLKVYANFSNSDLARNGLIPAYNSDLSIIPFLYSNNGISIGVGAFTGDVILGGDDPNLRRVYPDEGVSVFVDSGSGIVKQFLFENVGESIVSGLAPNTEDQILVIDGNGSVFLSTNLTANLAQRALVGTLSGESTFTSLSSPLPGDLSSEITATITFPTTIRNNYPDVIAGSSKGTFFAEQVRFYVKRTNLADSSVEYRHFTRTITPSLTSDTFILTYNAGTVATSIPSNTAFGLYTPSSIVVDNVTNIFPAENYTYEVCYCFVYTGTSITSINHSPSDGCIKEISLTLTDVIETSARYRGDWNSVTLYASGDIVYTPSTQSWWVANASSTNVSPSSLTPQWRLFSDLNYKIKTSSDDPTPGYLENKIVAGTGVSVSTVAEQVQISLSTSTGYNRIQDEGSNVTQRERLNFIGSSVSVTDDPSNTRTNVTINAIPSTEKGAINGVATLDSNGFVPSSQLSNQISVLGRHQTYTAAQGTAQVSLTDAPTVTVDAALSNSFTVTLGGNRTLANPTNTVAGFTYVFRIVQDATGSRTLAYGTNYKFPGGTVPTVSTAANAVDILTCYCAASGGNLNCTLTKDFR